MVLKLEMDFKNSLSFRIKKWSLFAICLFSIIILLKLFKRFSTYIIEDYINEDIERDPYKVAILY